jgi:SAM-dependent methyltransferase
LLRDRPSDRVLEIGFGAGALLLALSPLAGELHGIDLDADPGAATANVARRGVRAQLRHGDARQLPYESGFFDLVVSFSVFEHIADYPRALREVARVLRPGGHFLLGMPAVNKAMEWGFLAIGFKGIDDHHVTRPADVERDLPTAGFSVVAEKRLGLPRVPGAAIYYTWLLTVGSTGRAIG